MSRPGRYEWEMPCAHAADKSHKVLLGVKPTPHDEARRLMRRLRFGIAPADDPDGYQDVSPESAGKAAANPSLVRFTDRVRIIGVAENSEKERMPAEVYFVTFAGVRCVVPRSEATLIERATRLLPGQDIRVEGVRMRSGDDRGVVVIDNFVHAGIESPGEKLDPWLVVAQVEDGPPKLLSGVGRYELGFACRYAKDQRESLSIDFEEHRAIDSDGDRVAASDDSAPSTWVSTGPLERHPE
jgi:hypothetical protein